VNIEVAGSYQIPNGVCSELFFRISFKSMFCYSFT